MNRAIALIPASPLFCGLLIALGFGFGFGFVMLFVNQFATGVIPSAFAFLVVALAVFYLVLRSLKFSRWACDQIEIYLKSLSVQAKSIKRFRAEDVELDMAKAYMDETSGDYDIAKAIELLKTSAAQGHSEAQTELAKIYLTEDVSEFFASEDEATAAAIRLLAEASDKGFASAQTELADLYSTGSGVVEDWPKAINLYSRAARQGHGTAQYELGRAYFDGEHVEKNLKRALALLNRSAEQNMPDAQEMLGFIHRNGIGAQKDISKARLHYSKAAALGSNTAKEQLALIRT